jgi:hypothetical protein
VDPDQAWINLAAAIAADEWGRAGDIADDLLDWLAKDGFAPKITGKPEFDRLVARSTCEGIAAWDV